MYDEGSPVNKWHVEHFGHPSKVGYKDVIPTFKGEKFDPENLVGAYKRAGAKYFMSMGVHHDNFNMWNSPTHRWNAVAMGRRRTSWACSRRRLSSAVYALESVNTFGLATGGLV